VLCKIILENNLFLTKIWAHRIFCLHKLYVASEWWVWCPNNTLGQRQTFDCFACRYTKWGFDWRLGFICAVILVNPCFNQVHDIIPYFPKAFVLSQIITPIIYNRHLVHRIMNDKRPCKSNRPKERANILDDFDHCVTKRTIHGCNSGDKSDCLPILQKNTKYNNNLWEKCLSVLSKVHVAERKILQVRYLTYAQRKS
jgi:hypothetical protein